MRNFTKIATYPTGFIWIDMDQIVVISHAEHHQRVLILQNGGQVRISDSVENLQKLGILAEGAVVQ
jgi:hypothetical protein